MDEFNVNEEQVVVGFKKAGFVVGFNDLIGNSDLIVGVNGVVDGWFGITIGSTLDGSWDGATEGIGLLHDCKPRHEFVELT